MTKYIILALCLIVGVVVLFPELGTNSLFVVVVGGIAMGLLGSLPSVLIGDIYYYFTTRKMDREHQKRIDACKKGMRTGCSTSTS